MNCYQIENEIHNNFYRLLQANSTKEITEYPYKINVYRDENKLKDALLECNESTFRWFFITYCPNFDFYRIDFNYVNRLNEKTTSFINNNTLCGNDFAKGRKLRILYELYNIDLIKIFINTIHDELLKKRLLISIDNPLVNLFDDKKK